MLDILIRDASDNERSLDDVMRRLAVNGTTNGLSCAKNLLQRNIKSEFTGCLDFPDTKKYPFAGTKII